MSDNPVTADPQDEPATELPPPLEELTSDEEPAIEAAPDEEPPVGSAPDDDEADEEPEAENGVNGHAPLEAGGAGDETALDETALDEADDGDDASVGEAPPWLEAVCESLVLCAPEPLTPQRIRELLRVEGEVVDPRIIRRTLRDLVKRFADPERTLARGLSFVETGGAFVFRTVPVAAPYLRRMFEQKPQRLSKAALETLSIIAYRQPVTRPQIDEIRGVDCSGPIKNLLDRRLIRILGKADEVGRPLIYGTTKHFLDFFQLKSLSDLPTLREYHDLKGGAPEPLPDLGDPNLGPVRVMDLFDPAGSGDLVSRDTEEESRLALAALESALGEATEISRVAQSVAEGGAVPLDARAHAGRALVDFDSLADEEDSEAETAGKAQAVDGGEEAADEAADEAVDEAADEAVEEADKEETGSTALDDEDSHS